MAVDASSWDSRVGVSDAHHGGDSDTWPLNTVSRKRQPSTALRSGDSTSGSILRNQSRVLRLKLSRGYQDGRVQVASYVLLIGFAWVHSHHSLEQWRTGC